MMGIWSAMDFSRRPSLVVVAIVLEALKRTAPCANLAISNLCVTYISIGSVFLFKRHRG